MTSLHNVELIRGDSAQFVTEYFARTNSTKLDGVLAQVESFEEQRAILLGAKASYLSEIDNPDSKELHDAMAEITKLCRDKFHRARTEAEIAGHHVAFDLSQEIIRMSGEPALLELDDMVYHVFDGGLVRISKEEVPNPVTGGKIKRNAAIVYGDYERIVNNGNVFPLEMKASKGGARSASLSDIATLIEQLRDLDG